MKTLTITIEELRTNKFQVVGATKDNSIVLKEGGNWTKEDAKYSVQAVCEEWISKGYKINSESIKKYSIKEV
jgi:hypothetical protein